MEKYKRGKIGILQIIDYHYLLELELKALVDFFGVEDANPRRKLVSIGNISILTK
jgi:hypothetical protein